MPTLLPAELKLWQSVESEIKKIFGEVESKEGREMIVSPFSKNDSVKIIAGPFIDFTGSLEEVNDEKQKVKVVVSIFGRPTSVELDCFQIGKYNCSYRSQRTYTCNLAFLVFLTSEQ